MARTSSSADYDEQGGADIKHVRGESDETEIVSGAAAEWRRKKKALRTMFSMGGGGTSIASFKRRMNGFLSRRPMGSIFPLRHIAIDEDNIQDLYPSNTSSSRAHEIKQQQPQREPFGGLQKGRKEREVLQMNLGASLSPEDSRENSPVRIYDNSPTVPMSVRLEIRRRRADDASGRGDHVSREGSSPDRGNALAAVNV